ncbi:hypothetical protein AB1Y20_018236 [Prymnesium parvum]|uniref:Uncharacterized protein n=1 Tax=Prymnesium parvum TaxID=97485 RepID=A0AB34JP17_PRYPA
MLSLLTAASLGFNVAPRAHIISSPATAARASDASMLLGLLKKKQPATVTVIPSGMVGKVAPTKGVTTSPTVSTKLLSACGLDDAKKVLVIEDLFKSAGATVTASDDEVIVEGVVAPTPGSEITKEDVLKAQQSWSNAITSISKVCLEEKDFIAAAAYCAGELYGYGHTNVLFKPTKAAEYPFRPTAEEAMSYFVGGDVVEKGYDEDAGFAINGGKGWKSVKFTNHQIDLHGDTAIAMGSYVFTCATTGAEATVEYTFGYRKNADGKMRIFLHHSSVPFVNPVAPVTKAEVLAAQDAWAGAIIFISKVYAEKGDYIGAAGAAAGELYGYGHTNVLFKPTKAAEYPFRPTGGEAMSYFVGGKVVEKGYDEDAGFAINGGKGWKSVKFTNHQIDLNGPVAIAMGSYVFTCATTGNEVTVEYTFGYKRCADGKPRIFLHHSSVPFSAGPAPPTPIGGK